MARSTTPNRRRQVELPQPQLRMLRRPQLRHRLRGARAMQVRLGMPSKRSQVNLFRHKTIRPTWSIGP